MSTVAKLRENDEGLRLALDAVVQASAYAGITPPSVAVSDMAHCFAVYNPIMHRVTVAQDVLMGLGLRDLRTLLAHEVGHAKDRFKLACDALQYVLPLFALLIAIGISFGYIAHLDGVDYLFWVTVGGDVCAAYLFQQDATRLGRIGRGARGGSRCVCRSVRA
ncbi:M48 family metalloprotease [Duganella vulcania]|uniref:M48 family metalloprotease n=1 Tax=Duganella vulcania TaxID=2692166 RepID=A0A845GEW2_9BURK|nr:M48 family metalloprotease [Duganella vulcania]MYM92451.1 M48 family metalloprotease [Duganella vulcania]